MNHKKVITIAAGSFMALLVVASLITWSFQGWWIYTATKVDPNANPRTRGDFQSYKKIYITDPKKETPKVSAIWIKHADNLEEGEKAHQNPVTFILFHGFTSTIGSLLDKAAALTNCVPCNLLLMDYRGYGKSEGKPTEKAFGIDAGIAFNWVISQENVNPALVMLYGESDGAAVALQLASAKRNRILGVIVENPFLASRYEVYSRLWAPLRYLMWWLQTENFDNKANMHNLGTLREGSKIPHILALVSERDDVIPASHTIELLQLLEDKRKHYKKEIQGRIGKGKKSKKNKKMAKSQMQLPALIAMETVKNVDARIIPDTEIIPQTRQFLKALLPTSYFKRK